MKGKKITSVEEIIDIAQRKGSVIPYGLNKKMRHQPAAFVQNMQAHLLVQQIRAGYWYEYITKK